MLYQQAVALSCSHIGGDLLIVHTAITSLEQLANVVTISGSLTIAWNHNLVNFTGMSSLTSIGSLHITNNGVLASLDGLLALNAVAGSVYVDNNAQLVDVLGIHFVVSRWIHCSFNFINR